MSAGAPPELGERAERGVWATLDLADPDLKVHLLITDLAPEPAGFGRGATHLDIEVKQTIDDLHEIRCEVQLVRNIEAVRVLESLEAEGVHPIGRLAVFFQVALVVEGAIVRGDGPRFDLVDRFGVRARLGECAPCEH